MEKQNSSVLQEWRGIVDQCKSGKHANSQTAVKFAGILSSLLQSPDGVLGELLPDFSFLPSGTVGRAFAKTYGALPNEKRQAIWEWMGRQQPERRDAERTYALPGLIRGSSPYAFECLCDLKATNKEQRERLVSNLGEFSASTLSSIFETEEPEYKIRRVVNSLLAVAQEPRADLDFRAAILEAVAPAVRRYRWNTESALGKSIAAVTQRLSSSAAQRIGEILSTEAQNAAPLAQKSYPAGAAVDWQPLAGPSSSSKTEVQQKDMKNSSVDGSPQTTVTPAHIDDAVLDPLAWFDANIQMLAHARQFCADLQRRYEIERTRREELEGQTHANSEMEAALSAAHTQVQNLHTKLEEMARERNGLEQELSVVTKAADRDRATKASLESSLRSMQEKAQAWGHEREQLSRRIDMHAEKVVEDLRGAIASDIAPLVSDLPKDESPHLAELAPNLLIVIRQILNVLSERGIKVRRAAGLP